MVEAELLLGHLRRQVRSLQELLHYLERRPQAQPEDHSYSQVKLRELIRRLKELEHFSENRGSVYRMRAEWLN